MRCNIYDGIEEVIKRIVIIELLNSNLMFSENLFQMSII